MNDNDWALKFRLIFTQHTNTYKHTQTHTNTHKHTQTHPNINKHTQTHT
jgi:hypothetical protein